MTLWLGEVTLDLCCFDEECVVAVFGLVVPGMNHRAVLESVFRLRRWLASRASQETWCWCRELGNRERYFHQIAHLLKL